MTAQVIALLLLLAQASPDYVREMARFHRDREAELKADTGWLTVAGLFWLKPGVNTAGSAPGNDIVLPAKAPARLGTFEVRAGQVVFYAEQNVAVTRLNSPASAAIFDIHGGDEGAIAVGDLRLFPIQRGDRFGIRLRDLNSRMRREFAGIRSFPVAPRYRVTAAFHPEPREVPVPNVLGQAPIMKSPGYVTFTLDGKELRLVPVLETPDARELFFIFSDLTSRDATYPAGRFLYTPLPQNGVVVLDFNKAINPPCAFTDFATCPLPLKENRLPVRVEAGEKAYHGVTR